MSNTAIATKFVTWDVPTLDKLEKSKAYMLRKKLNDGKKMTREEKDCLTHSIINNSFFSDSIPLSGWRFSFHDVLTRYIAKVYGDWEEFYAVDKTALKKAVNGISEIVEIK